MATKLVSVLTGGTNSHQTSVTEVNNIATDFIAQGVVGTIGLNTGSGGTGSFAVSAQASPGMSVRVTNGQAYVTGTPTGGTSQTVRVSMDTFEDVTIAANATGGTRYDWVYIKLDADKMVNPAVDASDVATLMTSRSTSSATDNGTPPTYGYCLGVVTVANGASSITNSNITDSRTQTGTTRVAASGTVAYQSLPSGSVVQAATYTTSAVATGTTLIPQDDTIPQITEGDQYMSLAFTPRATTSTLIIQVKADCTSSAASNPLIMALFQDSTANAIAATSSYEAVATAGHTIILNHAMTAGTTSSTTFKVRIGQTNAGTLTFNGAGGLRRFGGVINSSIIITEVKA